MTAPIDRTPGTGPVWPQRNNIPSVQSGKPKEVSAGEKAEASQQITVDMSELELKAAMNQALGFISSDATRFAKADAEMRKDPVAFAVNHTTPEVRERAEAASVNADYDIQAFRGDTAYEEMGPNAFVRANLHGNPKDVARNFVNTGITEELDKIFA